MDEKQQATHGDDTEPDAGHFFQVLRAIPEIDAVPGDWLYVPEDGETLHIRDADHSAAPVRRQA